MFGCSLVSGCYFSLYCVDIKCKSHFWPSWNTTEKIEFVSKVVQFYEPETFGLLMVRSEGNFGSVIFEVRTAAGRWVWSPIRFRLRVLTCSNWTDPKIKNFRNHTIEIKLLYIYAKSIYIETISLLVMVSWILNFLNSSIGTGQYSQLTHYRGPNSTCGRGLNPKYYTAKVSYTSDH